MKKSEFQRLARILLDVPQDLYFDAAIAAFYRGASTNRVLTEWMALGRRIEERTIELKEVENEKEFDMDDTRSDSSVVSSIG